MSKTAMDAAAAKDTKKTLRTQALARRDALDPAFRARVSEGLAIAAGALGVAPGAVVSGFLPIRSEIDPAPLMAALARNGARLCLPAILDGTTMVFREYLPGAPLVDMGFGTRGPDETAATLDPQVLLVPLAAFDAAGNRIGYGAGHYDRAIARLDEKGMAPRLIGLAFDCQHVQAVPAEAHDAPLREMLSESGLRRFPLAS